MGRVLVSASGQEYVVRVNDVTMNPSEYIACENNGKCVRASAYSAELCTTRMSHSINQ